jgi:hypothetical protein
MEMSFSSDNCIVQRPKLGCACARVVSNQSAFVGSHALLLDALLLGNDYENAVVLQLFNVCGTLPIDCQLTIVVSWRCLTRNVDRCRLLLRLGGDNDDHSSPTFDLLCDDSLATFDNDWQQSTHLFTTIKQQTKLESIQLILQRSTSDNDDDDDNNNLFQFLIGDISIQQSNNNNLNDKQLIFDLIQRYNDRE